MRPPVDLGDVVVVALERHVPPGHEQEGRRPAVVVGLPERVEEPRFPMLVVVPLTTQIGPWADASPRLYPRLAAGSPGLSHDSVALLDNVRAVDVRRVRRWAGSLSEDDFAPIRTGLAAILGVEAQDESRGEDRE